MARAQRPCPHFNGSFIVTGTAGEVIEAMFGKPQQDAHIMKWRFVTYHYGSVANWVEARI